MYGIYTSFLWRSYDLSWELYQQYHPAAALDVVTRQGWLPDNREEIVGSRSTERSSIVGSIKYPRLFFRKDFLSKRFSFEKISFWEDFLMSRFSFEQIYLERVFFQQDCFGEDFLPEEFLLRRISFEKIFYPEEFLSRRISFRRFSFQMIFFRNFFLSRRWSPALVYASTNKHWHLCIPSLVRLILYEKNTYD